MSNGKKTIHAFMQYGWDRKSYTACGLYLPNFGKLIRSNNGRDVNCGNCKRSIIGSHT